MTRRIPLTLLLALAPTVDASELVRRRADEWGRGDDWGMSTLSEWSLSKQNTSSTLPDKWSASANPPSLAPSHSPLPSSGPSPKPSISPSPTDSLPPSMSPTVKPSLSPTESALPSSTPSVQPSLAPTESPMPSSGPSQKPSISPTDSPQPSMSPTDTPSLSPTESAQPSSTPSSGPSPQPSTSPTDRPSLEPSKPPSSSPSSDPSSRPSRSPIPSFAPSESPSPSSTPSSGPSPQPTKRPTLNPTLAPVYESLITTMCVVADTPYTEEQRQELLKQVESMPEDCEFVFHLGDLRSSAGFTECEQETYTNASIIMSRSSKPVFMLLGDNDWNDCPNDDEALDFWHAQFDGFLDTEWPSARARLNVTSQLERIENIYFIHKKALFIGLNIVGGWVHDEDEWEERLESNFNWTRDLIQYHVVDSQDANVVVMMAHASPVDDHSLFFESMRDYIIYELGNTVPILYLNGDTHYWDYEPYFYDQESWLRITLEGESREPILKVFVDGSAVGGTVEEAFSYDRRLDD